MNKRFHILLLLCFVLPSLGQEVAQPRQEARAGKSRGPFYSGTIFWRGTNDPIAFKGIVVTLGKHRNAFVCYDMDLLRPSLAWTNRVGQFGLTTPRFSNPPARVRGDVFLGTAPIPGWAKEGSLADPRERRMGPLPKDWAHYHGLYQQGQKVVLEYSVGSIRFLESPGYETKAGVPVFTRTIQATATAKNLVLNLLWSSGKIVERRADGITLTGSIPNRFIIVRLDGAEDPEWIHRHGTLSLELPRVAANHPFRIAVAIADGRSVKLDAAVPEDLRPLSKAGKALWPATVIRQGYRAPDRAAYVVDRITEPAKNPWKADTFFGGFDFFADGRAALTTIQGEVWIVSGIGEDLKKLRWRRFASGLFQGLGLKILNDKVYVLGRDQITRLHDRNGDGEADFYENFNNDSILSANQHEFCMDLQTDSQGNFYYAKGVPWHPHVTTPHQGCILKVSADGSQLEVFATGLRAPNGMSISPNDVISVSDNQGHWQPASKLNIVKQGGFYGMVPSAQRELDFTWRGTNFTVNPSDPKVREEYGFTGFGRRQPKTFKYDRPLAWLPMEADNSSGGQVWASDKWGPFSNHLLFMSYGKCRLFAVTEQAVGWRHQATMIPLPLRFDTGIMRGRVNPQDGQVYVCGLRGWQTSAIRAGGLYRVRYTGRAANLPIGFSATQAGVRLSFTDPLDPEYALDVDSYSLEQWNYHYSANYGSPHYSLRKPGRPSPDELKIKSVRLSNDGKIVTLAINDMRPSHQLQVQLNLKSADGQRIRQKIYATVPALAPITQATQPPRTLQ